MSGKKRFVATVTAGTTARTSVASRVDFPAIVHGGSVASMVATASRGPSLYPSPTTVPSPVTFPDEEPASA